MDRADIIRKYGYPMQSRSPRQKDKYRCFTQSYTCICEQEAQRAEVRRQEAQLRSKNILRREKRERTLRLHRAVAEDEMATSGRAVDPVCAFFCVSYWCFYAVIHRFAHVHEYIHR